MNSKTLAILSYITIIGWIVAYLQYKQQNEKSQLVRYHLGQGLGVFIASIVLSLAIGIVASVIPSLGTILSIAGLLPLVLLVLGAIAASNEACRPVPVIGKLFENKFAFLH